MSGGHSRRRFLATAITVCVAGCTGEEEIAEGDHTTTASGSISEHQDFAVEFESLQIERKTTNADITIQAEISNTTTRVKEYIGVELIISTDSDGWVFDSEEIYSGFRSIEELEPEASKTLTFEFEADINDAFAAERADCDFNYEVSIGLDEPEVHTGSRSMECDF